MGVKHEVFLDLGEGHIQVEPPQNYAVSPSTWGHFEANEWHVKGVSSEFIREGRKRV